MASDENWKETQVLVKDIAQLLGVPPGMTKDLLKTLENLIIHKLVEAVSTEDNPSDKDYAIELPYLGTLVVSLTGRRDQVSLSFAPRNSFYRKVRKACHTLESPLTEQVGEILGEHFVNLYEEGGVEDEQQ